MKYFNSYISKKCTKILISIYMFDIKCSLTYPRRYRSPFVPILHSCIINLYRLNPQNSHQRPNVAVLCGPHIQGAMGVNCARQLAVHNVKVTVFVPNFKKVIDDLEVELQLFDLTDGKRTNNVQGKEWFYSIM